MRESALLLSGPTDKNERMYLRATAAVLYITRHKIEVRQNDITAGHLDDKSHDCHPSSSTDNCKAHLSGSVAGSDIDISMFK